MFCCAGVLLYCHFISLFLFLAVSFDPNESIQALKTPLFYVSSTNEVKPVNVRIAAILIEHGAVVNTRNSVCACKSFLD